MSDKTETAIAVFCVCVAFALVSGCYVTRKQSSKIADLQQLVLQQQEQIDGLSIALTEARLHLNLPTADYSTYSKKDVK